MKKIETIWHELLYSALQDRRYKHTQQELANKFNYSLSTVHHALKVPSQIGALRKESKFFVLQDFNKLLYYWASFRNLKKDILYKTYYDGAVTQIEGFAPAKAIYACYSAARKLLSEPPADYDKVYFYIDSKELDKFKQRFPPTDKVSPNVFALKMLPQMESYGSVTSLPQAFVDIWNLQDWYGKDFTQTLEEKINGLLS